MQAPHDDDYHEDPEPWWTPIPGQRVISYNLPKQERPGGIKVRYKIRIATGDRAREIDARQAKVIMEILQWIRDQREQQEQAGQEHGQPRAGIDERTGNA